MPNGFDAKVLRAMRGGGGRAKDIAYRIGESDGRRVTGSLRRLRDAGLVSAADWNRLAVWKITEAGRKAAEDGS